MTAEWDYAVGDVRDTCGLCLPGGQEPHPACEEHRKVTVWDAFWRDELGWWE